MDPNKWTAKTQAAVSAAQVRVLGGEGEGGGREKPFPQKEKREGGPRGRARARRKGRREGGKVPQRRSAPLFSSPFSPNFKQLEKRGNFEGHFSKARA